MDISLWLSVTALALAIPLGVASNLLTAQVIAYLEKRRLLKSHRTKQQALIVFNRIKAFKEGRRDRYPFYLILASSAACCSVIASTLILVACIQQDLSFETRIAVALFALIGALMTIVLLGVIYETARQIERFDDYKAEFEKSWGVE
jgi:ABC-type Co2+ transport system permease subunit